MNADRLRQNALSLYKPPFWAGPCGYIWDSDNNMIADHAGISKNLNLQVRGWGRISYMPNAEALHDEVWAIIVESGATEAGITADQVAERITAAWTPKKDQD